MSIRNLITYGDDGEEIPLESEIAAEQDALDADDFNEEAFDAIAAAIHEEETRDTPADPEPLDAGYYEALAKDDPLRASRLKESMEGFSAVPYIPESVTEERGSVSSAEHVARTYADLFSREVEPVDGGPDWRDTTLMVRFAQTPTTVTVHGLTRPQALRVIREATSKMPGGDGSAGTMPLSAFSPYPGPKLTAAVHAMAYDDGSVSLYVQTLGNSEPPYYFPKGDERAAKVIRSMHWALEARCPDQVPYVRVTEGRKEKRAEAEGTR